MHLAFMKSIIMYVYCASPINQNNRQKFRYLHEKHINEEMIDRKTPQRIT